MTEDGQQNEMPESEKMLAEIEEAKAKSKESSIESAQSTEVTPSQTSEDKTAAADKGAQAVSQDVAKAPAKADKPEDDAREWAKKKGIKDADAAFRSLRELERKMHRMAFEKAKTEQVSSAPQYQPQPQFVPTPSYQAPPSYPPYPMDREKILEQEAKRYNMAPEDFERVLSLANDISAMQARKLEAQFNSKLQEIGQETRRNSELRELMQDPLFTNEKVQFEMHRVLEENPKAFTLEPSPYLYAFNEAQRRLARQYLQGDRGEVDTEKSSLPTAPPKEGSNGSSPSFEKTKESAIIESFSKAKTAEEQRKVLTSLGAVQSY